jgi:hypothetical protein
VAHAPKARHANATTAVFLIAESSKFHEPKTLETIYGARIRLLYDLNQISGSTAGLLRSALDTQLHLRPPTRQARLAAAASASTPVSGVVAFFLAAAVREATGFGAVTKAGMAIGIATDGVADMAIPVRAIRQRSGLAYSAPTALWRRLHAVPASLRRSGHYLGRQRSTSVSVHGPRAAGEPRQSI